MAGSSESHTQPAEFERRRIVRPGKRGGWAIYLPETDRAIAVLPTRGDAIARAKRILASRGGEIEVHQDAQGVRTLTVPARSTRRFGHVLAQRHTRRSVPRDPSATSS